MDEKQVRQRAEELLSQLSLKEKIGQVTQMMFVATEYDAAAEAVRKYHPGSFILCGTPFGGNDKQENVNREMVDKLQELAMHETPHGIPLLFGRDVIHGHYIAFPDPVCMTASFDPELVRESYDAIREEAALNGVNWTFTPMLDLSRDSRWGRIVEGPGEDPYLGELLGEAVIKGFQTDDLSAPGAVAACAKHYIGYGASEGGRDYNHTEISDYALQNMYLPAFRRAMASGVATVMSSFNEINGVPMTANHRLLTDVLRGQLGFDGMVVSDWNAVSQMHNYAGFSENARQSAKMALHAGVDMDMVDNCYLDHMEELIESGEVPMAELDEAVLRILKTKLRMGLFEHPHMPSGGYDVQHHLALAQKMAEESIVLLKNKDHLLPLSKTGSYAIGGPLYHDREELISSWSLDYKSEYLHSIRDAVNACAPQANFGEFNDAFIHEMMTLRDRDAYILIIGETRRVNGEAHSLVDLRIPETQLAMARQAKQAGKPVIAVLCFPRPIVLGGTEDLFDAILYAGHGGTRGADAIAAVLFGDAEPGGRLPYTLPYDGGQIPLYYNAAPGARLINGYYDEEEYWNYADCTGAPAYPFGYGMTYTDFTFSDPTVETDTLSSAAVEQGETFRIHVTVTNTGDRAGTAVTQLYVRDLVGSRVRPLRALRGIDRRLLQPGESADIPFTVGLRDLGFYLEDGTFILEPGAFEIYTGADCRTTQKLRVRVD